MYQERIFAADADPEDLPGLRARVRAETLGEYPRFCRSLAPDYSRVHRDIALGYAGLAIVLIAVAAAGGLGWIAGLAAAVFGAVGIGYAVAYLQLFIHEAAHYNIAPGRAANDRMANWLVCWQVGTRIEHYRRTHSEHHRHLGDADDTEISYTHRLTPRFLLEMITGVHALRVFTGRSGDRKTAKTSGGSLRPLVIGAIVHFAILATLFAVGAWASALAWLGGMGVFFPLFATLRQLLEHRPAPGQTGESAVTRLFGRDFFSRTFGGAGFNRHLLHHIEPQVSYTRYDDLEAYLMNTSVRDALEARRSSYRLTFAELLREGRS